MERHWELEEISHIVDAAILDTGMRAVLTIRIEEKIEAPIPTELIRLFLEKNNIVFGLDEELLANVCNNPGNYLGMELTIANGKAPLDGEDGYIKWEISDKTSKRPKELESGKVDFYSINQINNITKGQLIASKVAATNGEPGTNVSGHELPAKKGKDAVLKQGKNVVLNDNKDLIYAVIDGQVVLTEQNKINVFPIYEVTGDVDFGIGNIDFVGTVVIRGNVPDGFKIQAAGDIKVYGNVEGAELVAGGDIFVQQGLVGHNKSLIKAGGNFQSAFILGGDVQAGENIQVSQSIMHSNVSAGKQVICRGLKGIIVGGKTQAGDLVLASVIGNQLATATTIEVGISPEIRKEYNEILKQKSEFEDSLDKISKGLKLFEKLQQTGTSLPADKKQLQINLINQQIALEKQLKVLKEREQEIGEQLEDFEHASINVQKVVFPGVKLVIGKSVKFIKNEAKYLKYTLDEGVIVANSL